MTLTTRWLRRRAPVRLQNLNNKYIFDGSGLLRIQVANSESLNVKFNNDRQRYGGAPHAVAMNAQAPVAHAGRARNVHVRAGRSAGTSRSTCRRGRPARGA